MSVMDDLPAAPHRPGYMVIDTEGTGLFTYKYPKDWPVVELRGEPVPADSDNPAQPRMASLTIIYVDADLVEERRYSVFIRPNGWEMTEGATKVNGITTEYLNEHGIPVEEALNEFQSGVDNGYILVAHNAQHDGKQLRGELRRAGMDDRFEHTPQICTMRAMTNFCCIPPRGGRGAYKWPALSEALLFIGETELGDHTAHNDAEGALKLLRWLHKTGNMPEAKVYFAKNRPEPE